MSVWSNQDLSLNLIFDLLKLDRLEFSQTKVVVMMPPWSIKNPTHSSPKNDQSLRLTKWVTHHTNSTQQQTIQSQSNNAVTFMILEKQNSILQTQHTNHNPDLIKFNIIKSNLIKSDLIKSDPIKSNPIKSDPIKSDPIKSDPINSDPIKSDLINSVLMLQCTRH